jgi:hypothetical protein
MWHGTGAFVGALLLQTGAVWLCVVMLRSGPLWKSAAVVGGVAHGFDLAHVALSPLAPTAAFVAMAVAGPLYLLWFPLVGVRLLRRTGTPDGRRATRWQG